MDCNDRKGDTEHMGIFVLDFHGLSYYVVFTRKFEYKDIHIKEKESTCLKY
jgi:hypothetical protein